MSAVTIGVQSASPQPPSPEMKMSASTIASPPASAAVTSALASPALASSAVASPAEPASLSLLPPYDDGALPFAEAPFAPSSPGVGSTACAQAQMPRSATAERERGGFFVQDFFKRLTLCPHASTL